MSEVEERLHPKANIPIPPLQDEEMQRVIEQLQAKTRTNEDQLNQSHTLVQSLRAENTEIMTRYLKVKVFEDLQEDTSKYEEIILKDRIIITKLLFRCKELYGTVNESLLTTIVEHCIQQGITTRWHITKRDLQDKQG